MMMVHLATSEGRIGGNQVVSTPVMMNPRHPHDNSVIDPLRHTMTLSLSKAHMTLDPPLTSHRRPNHLEDTSSINGSQYQGLLEEQQRFGGPK
jgi:hypothetical protein